MDVGREGVEGGVGVPGWRSKRSERAREGRKGEGTGGAHLAGDAHRAPAVLIRHYHRLDQLAALELVGALYLPQSGGRGGGGGAVASVMGPRSGGGRLLRYRRDCACEEFHFEQSCERLPVRTILLALFEQLEQHSECMELGAILLP